MPVFKRKETEINSKKQKEAGSCHILIGWRQTLGALLPDASAPSCGRLQTNDVLAITVSLKFG